jgi:hypothetical protein
MEDMAISANHLAFGESMWFVKAVRVAHLSMEHEYGIEFIPNP